MSLKKSILVILDGWGYREETKYNAIAAAKTPNFDKLWKNYPHTTISASGEFVGLPDGQMGNSEVGHTNIGAGRIVYQDFTRINKSIKDGSIMDNKTLLQIKESLEKTSGSLHLMGLVSPGGVHSAMEHIYAVLEFAARNDIKKVFIHAFLDGRDTPPKSALEYIELLEKKIKEIGVGKIATVSGRFWAMDRDNRWDRVEKAYNALILGEGKVAKNAMEAVETSYSCDECDEFVAPTVIDSAGTIKDNDAV